jgi:hypothetical protein
MLLFHSQNVPIKKNLVKNGLRWKPAVGEGKAIVGKYWTSGYFLLDYPAETRLTVTFYNSLGTYCKLTVPEGGSSSNIIFPSWSIDDKITSIRDVTITPVSDDKYVYYYRGVQYN